MFISYVVIVEHNEEIIELIMTGEDNGDGSFCLMHKYKSDKLVCEAVKYQVVIEVYKINYRTKLGFIGEIKELVERLLKLNAIMYLK